MSDPLSVPAASNTFERIKRVNPAGAEFWSARELARAAGQSLPGRIVGASFLKLFDTVGINI